MGVRPHVPWGHRQTDLHGTAGHHCPGLSPKQQSVVLPGAVPRACRLC